jgi:hypothetical protein
MESTKKYLKDQKVSRTSSSTAKTSGAMNTNTWARESKDLTKDTAKVNASGRTTCMKAGGSETKESVKDVR